MASPSGCHRVWTAFDHLVAPYVDVFSALIPAFFKIRWEPPVDDGRLLAVLLVSTIISQKVHGWVLCPAIVCARCSEVGMWVSGKRMCIVVDPEKLGYGISGPIGHVLLIAEDSRFHACGQSSHYSAQGKPFAKHQATAWMSTSITR